MSNDSPKSAAARTRCLPFPARIFRRGRKHAHDARPALDLSCGGFGDLRSREAHGWTCGEVACELRYLPPTFPWSEVQRFNHCEPAQLSLAFGEYDPRQLEIPGSRRAR